MNRRRKKILLNSIGWFVCAAIITPPGLSFASLETIFMVIFIEFIFFVCIGLFSDHHYENDEDDIPPDEWWESNNFTKPK